MEVVRPSSRQWDSKTAAVVLVWRWERLTAKPHPSPGGQVPDRVGCVLNAAVQGLGGDNTEVLCCVGMRNGWHEAQGKVW